MLNQWFFLALIFMGLNWLAIWFDWKLANYLSKPAIILALLGWFFSTAGLSFPALWFGIGLAFALAGDTLLLFPGKCFLYGTTAFMVTHIAYIIGFNQSLPVMSPAIIALIMISFSLWVLIFTILRRAARSNEAYRTIEIPLIVYNLMILLMVISALTTKFRSEWLPAASALVSCGALLFLFSDVLLAVDRFIQPLPTARLWKRVTYQLGQLAIIAGVLLTFSA
ncbi:MAG: lysoplasmalogenase [Kiritimatiellota bacterium]|nr:lysoplasmalogenase [Kiritimatiellota bacterium]